MHQHPALPPLAVGKEDGALRRHQHLVVVVVVVVELPLRLVRATIMVHQHQVLLLHLRPQWPPVHDMPTMTMTDQANDEDKMSTMLGVGVEEEGEADEAIRHNDIVACR